MVIVPMDRVSSEEDEDVEEDVGVRRNDDGDLED